MVINTVGPGAFLTYADHRRADRHGHAHAGRDGDGQPVDRLVRRLRRESLGDWAGFSVAWLYWYFWVIVVGFEAVAGAGILQKWLPDVPLWLMSLVLLLMMTATNLYSVSSYGEFEYWFAGIKVAAIVVFLVLGALYVLGLWPGHSLDFSNLYAHGGFFPNGVGAIFSGIVVVIFSMVGAEIATIAAAESAEPERAIVRATNSVVAPHLHLLRGLDLPAGGHPAVEFQGAGGFGLCRRLRADGHRLGRQRHERGGAQRGAVLPEFRALHRLAHAVRAGGPRRGAGARCSRSAARASRWWRSCPRR